MGGDGGRGKEAGREGNGAVAAANYKIIIVLFVSLSQVTILFRSPLCRGDGERS